MAFRYESPYLCGCREHLTNMLVTTAANEYDLNQLNNLLHGEEVERLFRIIKCQFSVIKARFKGLMKNDS